MSEHTFHLSIFSPSKQLFEGEAVRITLPGALGSFTILAQHAPIVASLKEGVVSYVADGNEQNIEIKGGFVEMSNGTATVCIS